MRVRWLGWAGVEIEADGARVVIDPLADPAAVFAPLGDAAAAMPLPTVVAPEARGGAVAGLLTHLHRDHADAAALEAALDSAAPVCEPTWPGGEELDNLGLAQADAELSRAGLDRRRMQPWESTEVGPLTLTALPAVDGLGDPQVSWLIEAGERRLLHLGDTMFHGHWWRIARRGPFDVVLAPINGAATDFPHRQPPSPLPAVLEPEQAALAAELLGARTLVPIHYDGYGVDPWYRPVPDPVPRLAEAAADRPLELRVLEPGEWFEPAPAAQGSETS